MLRLLVVLLTNAVPLAGVLARGWSAPTVLALFWCETVLQGLFNCARIALHRRLTGLAGHWQAGTGAARPRAPLTRPGAPATAPATALPVRATASGGGTYLRQYATMVFPFSLAHGLFLGIFLFVLSANRVGGKDWTIHLADLGQGVSWIAGIAALDLLLDAATLSTRSFTWLQRKVESTYTRVLVLHLAIIFGMLALARFESPVAPLVVLIVFKAAVELLAAALGGGEQLPERPPRLFAFLLRQAGGDPAKEWREILEQDRRRRETWNAPLDLGNGIGSGRSA